MTQARKELVNVNETPYYHCICRCVRRAFLCGEDHLTGISYEHRKEWVVRRISTLSQVYAIEIGSYAIMSNHYHLVLRINEKEGLTWCDDEVARRWKQLYSWPLLVEAYLKGKGSDAEVFKAQEIIQIWRERLCNLSWYMRSLNEHLARMANKEDNCTGRFWEGRYKSQALLDDAAVLTCMSYVDLNPIRAAIADTPENSNFTSIQQRINNLTQNNEQEKIVENETVCSKTKKEVSTMINVPLMVLTESDNNPHAIGFTTQDYLELVDWAGRAIHDNKRGAISETKPPILDRLGLDSDLFLEHISASIEKQVQPRALGSIDKLKDLAKRWKQKFIRNQSYSQRLFTV